MCVNILKYLLLNRIFNFLHIYGFANHQSKSDTDIPGNPLLLMSVPNLPCKKSMGGFDQHYP